MRCNNQIMCDRPVLVADLVYVLCSAFVPISGTLLLYKVILSVQARQVIE